MPALRPSRQTHLGKLRRPRHGRVFERERLFADLDAVTAPGIWVAGALGSGKTTLVATYLQAKTAAFMWLQLDAGDADPATFVHFLLAAVAPEPPHQARRVEPPGTDDLRDFPAYLRRLFRRLAADLDVPWALVLDNAQELGDESAVHSGMAAVLAELPERARVFFISREPPPDAYARALAGQHLALVDERQLRFDDDEAERLVTLHRRDWRGGDLRQATDGWAAAMILLLATRTELSLDEALRGSPAREQLFAFFAAEVLAGMSSADAAALMRIAFLPSASVTMAVAISGDARAGNVLDGLARRSLFTERCEGAPPTYTFHALFNQYLQMRASEQLSAADLLALRETAADLLATDGRPDAAIAQMIGAQAWDKALTLIVGHAGHFVAQGRTVMLRDYILALPQALRDRQQAWYWLGCCELAIDPALALHHFERAHLGFVAEGDEQGSFRTAAAAADAIIFIGANLHALDPWMPLLMAHAPAYLKQRNDESDLLVLPGLLAAFVHRETVHPLTAVLAERAERLLDQALGASQRILLGTLAYYLLWTGQTQRLDRIMLKLDRLCAASDAAPGTLLRWYGVSVLVRALLGHVDTALQHAQQALALTANGQPTLRAKAHLMLALAAVASHDRVLARAQLLAANGLLDADNAIDSTTYEFQRALLMLLDSD